MCLSLHNPPGQRLPMPAMTNQHTSIQCSVLSNSRSYSTTRPVFSFVSSGPKTSPNAAETVQTGFLADANPIRFSTKWWDLETDLGWWGYRWMEGGRWLSRDPSEEEGGIHLYVFVANEPISRTDYLGLAWTIKRYGERWATATPKEKGDSWQSLAEKYVGLDQAERTKWIKKGAGFITDDEEPTVGCHYGIPNTKVFYTTPTRFFDGSGMANILRKVVKDLAEKAGPDYKVIPLIGKESVSEFIKSFKEDGILEFYFGGHGHTELDGALYAKDSNKGVYVEGSMVDPPYKLAFLGLLGCRSLGPASGYFSLISPNGGYYGFNAKINMFNWEGHVVSDPIGP